MSTGAKSHERDQAESDRRTRDLVAVIIAGGSGKRFWPLSDSERPKQFLRLFSDRTLIQSAYDRLCGLVPPQRVIVVTGERFVPVVREQLPDIPAENIIGEPVGRDTAPAVALSAVVCRRRFGNPVMLVTPADHMIRPVELFQATAMSAVKRSGKTGTIYTFGIAPTYPATGYGYLELGRLVMDDSGIGHYGVERFREKPDLETARRYCESGRFCWNSGMFVWTVDAIMAEIRTHLPDLASRLFPLGDVYGTNGWQASLRTAFEGVSAISIDFGVMEKAERICTVRAEFEWNDVGGWEAVARYLDADGSGNATRANCKALDSADNLVFCENGEETVALIGVDNLAVVRAGNKTLVCDRRRAEDVKRLVDESDLV